MSSRRPGPDFADQPTGRSKSFVRQLSVSLVERAKLALTNSTTVSLEDVHYFANCALDYAKLLEDHTKMVDSMSELVDRSADLLDQRRQLADLVSRIAAADPDARDAIVAEALVAAKAMQ